MADDFDLNALVRPLDGDSLKAMLDARRAAEQAPLPPPTTIPQPDFPYFGVVRFHCPLDCGWHHDESPGAEPMGPLLLPVDFTPADVSTAITDQASARHDRFRRRVESAIAAHFDDAHPGR